MTAKLDLKNDPKFLERVNQLNNKLFMRILKEPVEIVLGNDIKVYIAAIGLNGSYLAVIPGRSEDGTHTMGEIMLCAYQTDKNSSAYESTQVAKFMSMWLITCTESDFELVKHRDFDIVKSAIDTIRKVRGDDYFDTGSEEMYINIHGIIQTIKNPYRTFKR